MDISDITWEARDGVLIWLKSPIMDKAEQEYVRLYKKYHHLEYCNLLFCSRLAFPDGKGGVHFSSVRKPEHRRL